MDASTYSYHDHRLGLRVLLHEPQRFWNHRLYYEFHVGAFQHLVYWEYLGGYSPIGDRVDNNHWDGWLAAELGTWVGYSLGDRLDIGIQVLGEYRLMPSEKARYRRGRLGITTGVRWNF